MRGSLEREKRGVHTQSHLGGPTGSALRTLARVLDGRPHETDPSKESCLRTRQGGSAPLWSVM